MLELVHDTMQECDMTSSMLCLESPSVGDHRG